MTKIGDLVKIVEWTGYRHIGPRQLTYAGQKVYILKFWTINLQGVTELKMSLHPGGGEGMLENHLELEFEVHFFRPLDFFFSSHSGLGIAFSH